MDINYRMVASNAWTQTVRLWKRELYIALPFGIAAYSVLPLYALATEGDTAWAEVGPIAVGMIAAVVVFPISYAINLYRAPYLILTTVDEERIELLKKYQQLNEKFVDASERRKLSRTLKDDVKGFDRLIHRAQTATRDAANLRDTRDVIEMMIRLLAAHLQDSQWEHELGYFDPHGPYRGLGTVGSFLVSDPSDTLIEHGYGELIRVVEITKERISAIISDIDGMPVFLDFGKPVKKH